MAMVESVMSDIIKTQMILNFTVVDETELAKLTDAIAKGVVTHIVAAAAVSTSGLTGTGPAGGPLPLAAVPGTIT